jgi:diacylglycerol kinase (ATP)
MFILLNARSNDGRGRRKWEESRSELEERFPGQEFRVAENPGDLAARLGEEYARGERVFAAAGGDGTVNYLLNAIMNADGLNPALITLGAIGLGSSNDFHKPYDPGRRTRAGIYFRLDATRTLPANVGRADYEDENGLARTHYFMINASLGIIARGNYLFNIDEGLVRWLKPRWVTGTIWYLTLRTLITSENVPLRLAVAGDRLETEATTLSVVLNPHFTGSLSYGCGDYSRRDAFGVALCERMGIPERLRTLSSLSKARFQGLPKTRFWESPFVEIDTVRPSPFEMDGEVVLARKIRVRLLKGAIQTCP